MTKTQNTEVETQEVSADLSPIEVAKLAGVRPQMVYNYINAGRIEATRNEANKLRVTREVAEAWVAKYEANKVARAEKAAAQTEAELAGTNA